MLYLQETVHGWGVAMRSVTVTFGFCWIGERRESKDEIYIWLITTLCSTEKYEVIA